MEEEKTIDIVVAEYEKKLQEEKEKHEKEVNDLKKTHAEEVKSILSGRKTFGQKEVGKQDEDEKESFLDTEIKKTKKILKIKEEN